MTKPARINALARAIVALAVANFCVNYLCRGAEPSAPPEFSGIYPRLAQFNSEGECGTGAVVAWAGKLWTISYGPHLPKGSSDKLYEIDDSLSRVIRDESVGGTHANRMIHRETNQLFIGSHAIDANGDVRTIPRAALPGRITAVTRSLTDPANKVYFLTMEEGMYEVDAHTLETREIYKDGNGAKSAEEDVLPGYHGKGGYASQGRVVYANNGENSEEAKRDPTTVSGCLAEWFGETEGWRVVERKQFTEVTTRDGIYGGESGDEVLWSLGWDQRSVILEILDGGEWRRYRLPKASHCYDGAHGWNTEWPRIRKIDSAEDYLATMHGQFWHFPSDFSATSARGIRPRSSYLKVIGDFEYWNDRVVFGCDDSAKSEFLNKTAFKNAITGPGRSNSNLWFVAPSRLEELGPALGRGAVWLRDDVKMGDVSDPYLAAGYDYRTCYVAFEGSKAAANSKTASRVSAPVVIQLQADRDGAGTWENVKTIEVDVDSAGAGFKSFDLSDLPPCEWIRVSCANADLVKATCFFHYRNSEGRRKVAAELFNGVARPADAKSFLGARLWTRGDNERLAVVSQIVKDGALQEERYYELSEDGALERVECRYEGGEPGTISRVKAMVDATPVSEDVCTIDDLSVLVQYRGARYRLPIGSEAVVNANPPLVCRLDREVVTERDLFHCAGTFYELPAENAGGFPKIRPIATDGRLITDYASYRGLLVLAGASPDADSNDSSHIVRSEDGQCALWLGAIDDLWSFGKPVGRGAVWRKSEVKAGEPSDPMLATGFDRKRLVLQNHSDQPTLASVEADITGDGAWYSVLSLEVGANETVAYEFPESFGAYWLRLTSTDNATLSAEFIYE